MFSSPSYREALYNTNKALKTYARLDLTASVETLIVNSPNLKIKKRSQKYLRNIKTHNSKKYNIQHCGKLKTDNKGKRRKICTFLLKEYVM